MLTMSHLRAWEVLRDWTTLFLFTQGATVDSNSFRQELTALSIRRQVNRTWTVSAGNVRVESPGLGFCRPTCFEFLLPINAENRGGTEGPVHFQG